jgi:hypothetical protein
MLVNKKVKKRVKCLSTENSAPTVVVDKHTTTSASVATSLGLLEEP